MWIRLSAIYGFGTAPAHRPRDGIATIGSMINGARADGYGDPTVSSLQADAATPRCPVTKIVTLFANVRG